MTSTMEYVKNAGSFRLEAFEMTAGETEKNRRIAEVERNNELGIRQIGKLQGHIDKLTEELRATERDCRIAEEVRDDFGEQLERKQEMIDELTTDYHDLKSNNQSLIYDLNQQQKRIKELSGRLARTEKIFKKIYLEWGCGENLSADEFWEKLKSGLED